MRQYLKTVIALGILAGLIGWYMVQSETQPAFNPPVFSVKPGSIVAISVVSPNGTLTFAKTNDRWLLQQPLAAAVDQAKMATLEQKLYDLSAVRLLGRNQGASRQDGLENPRSRITIQIRDGETQTLFIGAETPSKTEYYAASAPLGNVFTLGKSDIDAWQGEPGAFMDKNLMALDPAQIESLRLSGASQTWQWQLMRDKGNGGNWRLTLPVQAPVKGERVRELLVKVAGLQIADFISPKGDHAERYGLDKPAFTLTVRSRNGQEQTVFFGKNDPVRRLIYVKINRNPMIYGIDSAAFRPEELQNGAILDVAPLSVGIGEVTEITIMDQAKRTVMTRDTSKANRDVFNLAGRVIDPEQFNPLYINLMALSAGGLDPANGPGALGKGSIGNPELTVIFKLRGNRNLRVDFSKRDETTYFMTLAGKRTPFFTTTQKITLVRQWLQRVLQVRG